MTGLQSAFFKTVIFPKGTIFERLKGRPGGNGKKLEIELEIADSEIESSGDIELSLEETDFSLDGIIIFIYSLNIFILKLIFDKYVLYRATWDDLGLLMLNGSHR